MRAGLTMSVALHAGITMASLVALPQAQLELEEVVVIPVTLMTVAPARPEPAQPPPEPQQQAQPAPLPLPEPSLRTNDPVPAEETIPDPEATETTARELASQRLASRFQSILKSVEDRQKENTEPRIDPFDSIPSLPDEEKPEIPDVIPNPGDQEEAEETLGSAHLRSLVKLRIERDCWRDPSDMADAARLNALISFKLTRTGDLVGPPRLRSPTSLSNDSNLRVFVQRAFRAIRACAPYDFLPPGRYAEWRLIVVNFSGAPK